MSRISIYVPQTTAPGLPGPEIVPIDGSRGLLGGLKSIIETIDAKNQREAAARAGAPAESGNAIDPSLDEVQQPATRKDGVAGPTDPNDRAVNAIDAKEKQDASAYSANVLAKLAERGLNLAQLSADTAPGHTLDINNQFEKGLNEALAGAPNDFARQMIVRQMPRVQGDIHRAALNAEAFANIAKRNADATETLEIYGRLVQADPSQVQLRMDEAAALGRSMLMSSIERKAFEAKRLELPRIALASLIDRNPEGAVLEMKQGRWSQYIDSETLNRMQTMAEHQITLGQQNSNAESDFNSEHLRLDLGKFGKALLDGQAISGANSLNSPGRFTDVLGDNVAKAATNTLAAQREIGAFFANAQTFSHQILDNLSTIPEKSRNKDSDPSAHLADLLTPEIVRASFKREAAGLPLNVRSSKASDSEGGIYQGGRTSPVRTTPYEPRSPTPEDDRLEKQNPPRKVFHAEGGINLPDPVGMRLEPFNPANGYNQRLQRRIQTAQSAGTNGAPLRLRTGIDTDGRPYTAFFRVGSDQNDDVSLGLTEGGANKLAALLFDKIVVVNTVDDAVRAIEQAYGGHMPPDLDPEELRQALINNRVPAFFFGAPPPSGSPATDRVLTLFRIRQNEDALQADRRKQYGDPRRAPGAERQLSHEIGHLLSEVMGLPEYLARLPATQRKQVDDELHRLFVNEGHRPDNEKDSWARDPNEWIAEFFKAYLVAPESAKRVAPLLTSIVRKLWNENPRANKTLILSSDSRANTVA